MKNIKRKKMPAMKLMGLLLVTYLIGTSFSSLSAKSVGQFYWNLPSIKFNSSAEYQATTLGTGFHVTAGELDTPAHQADIGLSIFTLLARPRLPNASVGTTGQNLFNLGYVYHWSDNYDFDERSNNVHFAIGFVSSIGASPSQASGDFVDRVTAGSEDAVEDRNQVGDLSEAYDNFGWYWRLAYFRAIPSSKQATLIGFSVMSIYYARSTGYRRITTAVASDGTATGNVQRNPVVASTFNSTDLSLIIGTRF